MQISNQQGLDGQNGSYDGVFVKQDVHQHKPLYVKGDKVIAWDSKWGHWWLQESKDAGKMHGHAWLKQTERDDCPGGDHVLVEENPWTHLPEKNVTITPSSQCNVLLFDVS